MYRLSDSDSVDSDKGIRYKTDSIRNKDKERHSKRDSSSKRDRYSRREKKRSRSRSRHRENKKKKLKKRKKDDSSEEDVRSGSKHREKTHKDIRKERDSPDRKNTSSGQSLETSKRDSKNEIDSKLSDIKQNNSLDPSRIIGPALPPHLIQKNLVERTIESPPSPKVKEKLIDSTLNSSQNTKILAPSPNPVGPALPPSFNKKLTQTDANTINPPLPPDLTPPEQTETEKIQPPLPSSKEPLPKVIGPTLPPGFQQKSTTNEIDIDPTGAPDLQPPEQSAERVMGPSLPPDLKKQLETSNTGDSSEEEVYGPVPVGDNYSKAHIELEERALKIKIDQLEPEGDKQATREEWMLTLPEAKASKFGLGPRSFRAKAGPDLSDRSSWTDTPEDKVKKKLGKAEPKVDLQKEAELREIRKRDKEQEAIAKKNKKHKESLLEIHQKKSKDKSESGPSERRPFSREIDLQVNRFDEAQKKAVLKKAQLLDTRFSTGESKYL